MDSPFAAKGSPAAREIWPLSCRRNDRQLRLPRNVESGRERRHGRRGRVTPQPEVWASWPLRRYSRNAPRGLAPPRWRGPRALPAPCRRGPLAEILLIPGGHRARFPRLRGLRRGAGLEVPREMSNRVSARGLFAARAVPLPHHREVPEAEHRCCFAVASSPLVSVCCGWVGGRACVGSVLAVPPCTGFSAAERGCQICCFGV